MNWKNKQVLVTGSEGFIGSHLVEALVQRGAKVRAFVLYNSFGSWGWLETLPEDVLKQVEIFTGDVRDAHRVREAMEGVEVVFHLAALIAIPYSYHAPEQYLAVNVGGTLNVLQAARLLKTPRVIHTSTSEVYGSAQFVPITEAHPLVGQSPYAASKIAADQFALSFHKSFATPVTVVRPFNTFGPRQSARAVIPTVLTQVLSGARMIKLGSLHPTRDFTFVTDTARGFIMAAESDKGIGEVTNLGTNSEISIGDLVDKVRTLLGVELEVETEDQRKRPALSEVERLHADNRRAKEIFGWSPQTTFDEGLKLTAEWLRGNLSRYKQGIYNV